MNLLVCLILVEAWPMRQRHALLVGVRRGVLALMAIRRYPVNAGQVVLQLRNAWAVTSLPSKAEVF